METAEQTFKKTNEFFCQADYNTAFDTQTESGKYS